jgi:hypothetical protein
MDLGLGNLVTLKAHLLNSTLRAGTAYDTQLATLGAGVAASFEKYCNRKFGRVVDDTYVCSADRDHTYVPRYPIEEIDSLALKSSESEGFVTLSDALVNADYVTGQVYFAGKVGSWWQSIRITYTGGYWFNTAEEDTAQPSGTTALPDDLKLAWVLQCEEIWNKRDKLGIGLAQPSAQQFNLAALDLLPQVKNMLDPYRRYQIV